ncbi:MAG: hypothetical protein HY437_00830 [Candidatus Magasanikbacteria bacterium]|nr:hypothetical protein [Candidatus Magasanikbacteria bacterium]
MKPSITWKEVEIVGPSPRSGQKESYRFKAVVPYDFRDLKERGGPYWAILVTAPGGESIVVVDNDRAVYFFTKIVNEERYRLDAEVERVPNDMGHPYPGIATTLRGVAERGIPNLQLHLANDNGGTGLTATLTR